MWRMLRIVRQAIGQFFCYVVPAVTLFAIIVFTVSPRAVSLFGVMATNEVRLPATIDACELFRDGIRRAHAVRCDVHYTDGTTAYRERVNVWTSRSPFTTLESLQRTLADERGRPDREISLSRRYPTYPDVIDDRWLAMPGLTALLVASWITLAAITALRERKVFVHRRADYVLDRATDALVPISDARARRLRAQAVLWLGLIGFGMLICLQGLSNRLSQEAAMIGMRGAHAVPAVLQDCARNYYGTRKGHHQIDCAFRYTVGQTAHAGQAESLDFRSFPTRARMDAQVAALDKQSVTAWVHPAAPTYAWASIDTRWFVPYTFGLFELILMVLVAGVCPVAAALMIARYR